MLFITSELKWFGDNSFRLKTLALRELHIALVIKCNSKINRTNEKTAGLSAVQYLIDEL